MKSRIRRLVRCGAVTTVLAALAACGGGNSAPSHPPGYLVGGTVTGLSGPGLILQVTSSDGNAQELPVSESGGFTFGMRIASGAKYSVTVKSAPMSPPQVCTVADGDGTVRNTDVTNVAVACEPGYTAGGTVSGLQGSGLVLQIFAPNYIDRGSSPFGPPLPLSANGPFTFDVVYPPNPTFGMSARVVQQPSSPPQLCVVRNSGIKIQAANKTDMEVVCSKYAYVANVADNTVSAYAVDAASGALTAVSTVMTEGQSPQAIVGALDGQYVYVGYEASNDVAAFTVDPVTGVFAGVPGSPFAAGANPRALAIYHSFNTYLYVANAGSGTISAFAVDTGSGSLTPLSPAMFPAGQAPSSIVVNGNIMYVANSGGSNDVSAFSIDPHSGSLVPVPGSPFPAGASPLGLALGAGGRFLYTANPDATDPSISAFSIDGNGALTPLPGSPFPLAASHGIATDLAGAYLYVTAGSGVVGYAIDGTTGMLSPLPGFPVAAGVAAHSIAVDSLNQFLYVTNDGSADISGFRLDPTTGGLTPMQASPFPAGHQPDFITVF